MKTRALSLIFLFSALSAAQLTTHSEPRPTFIDGRPTMPPATIPPEYIEQIKGVVNSALGEGTQTVMRTATPYVLGFISIGAGVVCSGYGIFREGAGKNKKTIATVGTGAGLIALGTCMLVQPIWFKPSE